VHTAYFAKVRIHYFCHPLHGEEVEVFARYQCATETFYLISLFDNSRVLTPVWMADEAICSRFEVRTSAVCSLTSLRQLRALLDTLAIEGA
jgi:hypothetical protein